VGCSSFGLSSFLFRHVCGNHIVWGVSELEEIRLRHVGSADRRASTLFWERVEGYADASARVEEARIRSAKLYVLGRDREQVLRRVAAMELPALTRARARVAWEWAEE